MSTFIESASVKVMRSYDYCHFEVVLGIKTDDANGLTPVQIDDRRKQAARLADKAVEQYKIARRDRDSHHEYDRRNVESLAEEAMKTPGSERTPEEKAIIKKANDDAYWESRGHYDYEDDWED